MPLDGNAGTIAGQDKKLRTRIALRHYDIDVDSEGVAKLRKSGFLVNFGIVIV